MKDAETENLWDALTGQADNFVLGGASDLLNQWNTDDMFRAAGVQKALMESRDLLMKTGIDADPNDQVQIPVYALLAFTRLALKKLQ